ncbi:14693_t:CDS:2 [Dentiscutata heterogama]|uniref:14693_t:CDS:1 n=1 Tax=Dentiscutata heterogama TaxID=1316150 RepID=A0ACA9M745_9GLOM|nr:14693_t:CDS:2 [Dentiscutata heterogama]
MVIQRLDNFEKFLKDQQKSEEAISISNIKRSDWNKIQIATGLKLEVIDPKFNYEVKSKAFQWEARLDDLKSSHTVLTVLTDIIDDRQFFCFEDGRIVTFTLSRGKALSLIHQNLKYFNRESDEEMRQSHFQNG